MTSRTALVPALIAAAMLTIVPPSLADDLRNIKHGEAVPALRLPGVDGAVIDSDTLKGSVIVYVCLSADQKRSESAASESQQVVAAFGDASVRLVHVTSDVVQKSYFERYRTEHSISAPLALDADRSFYAKLGLIAFPTTVIVDRDGKLNSVILLHGNDYKSNLEAYIRHALGTLSDAELKERLAARPSDKGSPKSAASAHRALARLMRDKGQYDEAKAELAKGLELDPDNNEMRLDMVEIDIATSNLDKAELLVTKVLASQPDHRRAMQLKGAILFRRDRLEEAQAILEQALPLNPSPEIVHYYLGQIMERKGNKDAAIDHYRESLRHFIKDPSTKDPSSRGAQPSKPN